MYAVVRLGEAQADADCSGWETDPQSFGKVVAEHYVRTVLGQALHAKRVRPYASSSTMWEVWFPNDIVVGVTFGKIPDFVAAAQIYTAPLGPFRYYTYFCTQKGELVLRARRPPGSSK